MTGYDPASVTAPGEWIADAACAEVGGDYWHPERGEPNRDAKRVCGLCAVRTECLEYALTNDEHGVWGGMSEQERQRIKRVRAAAAVDAFLVA